MAGEAHKHAGEVPEGYEPIESFNKFAGMLGPIYERAGDDGTWARGFLADDKHTNMAGVVHGGMLMTFADVFLSRAVMEVAEPPFVTLSMACNFVSPAFNGTWIEGRGRVQKRGREIVFLEGEIISRSKIVMTATAQFKLLRPRKI